VKWLEYLSAIALWCGQPVNQSAATLTKFGAERTVAQVQACRDRLMTCLGTARNPLYPIDQEKVVAQCFRDEKF
jgi:hypothetical protein